MYRDETPHSYLVTAFNSVVVMLDPATGEERWRVDVAGTLGLPIRLHAREHDLIALAASELVVLALNDGSVLLRIAIPGATSTGVLLVQNERAFVSASGVLTCIDLDRGVIAWRNDFPGTGYGPSALAMPGVVVQADMS